MKSIVKIANTVAIFHRGTSTAANIRCKNSYSSTLLYFGTSIFMQNQPMMYATAQ